MRIRTHIWAGEEVPPPLPIREGGRTIGAGTVTDIID